MDEKVNNIFVIVDGIRTHLLRAGKGKPLLLVHGLGAPLMWQRVFEPLSSLFDVIIIDLPGFGESDCPPKLYSTEDYAVFLDHLLHSLCISTLHIVGISYGGQIAATFAYMFPERVDNLVLIASTGLQKPRWFARNEMIWRTFATVMKYTVMRSTIALSILSRRSYFDIHNQPDHLVENFLKPLSEPGKRDVWLNALRNVFSPNPNFQKELTAINHRTLIAWGAKDRAVPVSFANELHRRIRQSTLKVLPECSHSLPLEKPIELCNAIQSFVY